MQLLYTRLYVRMVAVICTGKSSCNSSLSAQSTLHLVYTATQSVIIVNSNPLMLIKIRDKHVPWFHAWAHIVGGSRKVGIVTYIHVWFHSKWISSSLECIVHSLMISLLYITIYLCLSLWSLCYDICSIQLEKIYIVGICCWILLYVQCIHPNAHITLANIRSHSPHIAEH